MPLYGATQYMTHSHIVNMGNDMVLFISISICHHVFIVYLSSCMNVSLYVLCVWNQCVYYVNVTMYVCDLLLVKHVYIIACVFIIESVCVLSVYIPVSYQSCNMYISLYICVVSMCGGSCV